MGWFLEWKLGRYMGLCADWRLYANNPKHPLDVCERGGAVMASRQSDRTRMESAGV